MKIPSNEITKIGEKAELDWLRDKNNDNYIVKASAFQRITAEHNYMKKFIDEIYKAINKE